ncbi:MAG: hypothetical protein QOD72_489, partial [Acidimicrobiaceae bacterium]|nr:hypothetical protein [Acidimicrobiaceae bacterium]
MRSSDVSEHTVERARHPGEIQRVDQRAGVLALPAGSGAHEATQLCFDAASLLGRLLLEDAERSQIALS